MQKETAFQKIMRKTGRKPVECKCQQCKSQCSVPCKGTPEDMVKIAARYPEGRIMATELKGVPIITPLYDKAKGSCTFFNNGLCDLHSQGLKPTEGKLSHHSQYLNNEFSWKKSVTYWLLKEWENINEEEFKQLLNQHIKLDGL